jgi:hypothetical protein
MSENSQERAKFLRAAYAEALKELRNEHPEEFHNILSRIYERNGVAVKKRLTGPRKIKADLEKLQARLKKEEAQV